MNRPQKIAIAGALLISTALTVAFGFSRHAEAQKRPARPVQRTPQPKPGANYSVFLHSTREHQADCKTCHVAPSANWKKVGDFPDVTDYPDHDSCVRCHRPQFFRGAQPQVCGICHTKISPRDDARQPFPEIGQKRDFSIVFPHDKHQDVIARMLMPNLRLRGDDSSHVFRQVSFVQDVKAGGFNNCSICHVANAKAPVAPEGGWVDKFVPTIDTFKASPQSHSSCFNCHWKQQEPVATNCAGCHKAAPAAFAVPPSPQRISMKFRHEGGGEKKNHLAECTTCHINITRAATLSGLLPDVPITSCTECHNKDGLRLDLSSELAAIDKNKSFACSYCHTSDVGKRDPPPSHTIAAGRPQLKRAELK